MHCLMLRGLWETIANNGQQLQTAWGGLRRDWIEDEPGTSGQQLQTIANNGKRMQTAGGWRGAGIENE